MDKQNIQSSNPVPHQLLLVLVLQLMKLFCLELYDSFMHSIKLTFELSVRT